MARCYFLKMQILARAPWWLRILPGFKNGSVSPSIFGFSGKCHPPWKKLCAKTYVCQSLDSLWLPNCLGPKWRLRPIHVRTWILCYCRIISFVIHWLISSCFRNFCHLLVFKTFSNNSHQILEKTSKTRLSTLLQYFILPMGTVL